MIRISNRNRSNRGRGSGGCRNRRDRRGVSVFVVAAPGVVGRRRSGSRRSRGRQRRGERRRGAEGRRKPRTRSHGRGGATAQNFFRARLPVRGRRAVPIFVDCDVSTPSARDPPHSTTPKGGGTGARAPRPPRPQARCWPSVISILRSLI